MENNFASRLIAARKMAGLSLQSLANKLGNVITKQSLHKYEQGKMKPDSDIIISLANTLRVPVDFFFSNPRLEITLTNVDYRKFSSRLTKTDEVSIEEKVKDTLERYFELESIVNLGEVSEYFNYDTEIANIDDAEKAAKKLRKQWNLGYDPIPDVVEMLEDKGYKVVEIEASEKFDGMKAETNGKKVIVLNKSQKNDVVRKRLTALHELAHHSLKFSKDMDGKAEEKLCHSFAAAVLYPEEMVRRDLHQDRFNFYQNELILIKERWGISFTAIFKRAHKLGIINDYVYKSLNVGYRSKMLHNNEPGRFLSKESPIRFERLIYFALAKELISINEAAYFSGMSSWKFRETMKPLV
jgi:Zn-dependent peptidase ImmA (M78 family)/transcriptional regulator with XRE-family HTH domain